MSEAQKAALLDFVRGGKGFTHKTSVKRSNGGSAPSSASR